MKNINQIKWITKIGMFLDELIFHNYKKYIIRKIIKPVKNTF